MQLGTLEKVFVIDTRVIDISALKPILESPSIVKVGHNLQFEYKHILHNFCIKLDNIWDTMICEKVLYNGLGLSNSLEALANRYLGVESIETINLFNEEKEDKHSVEPLDSTDSLDLPSRQYIDKSTRLGFINIGDSPFTIKQIMYGADDIVYPLKIKKIQEKGREVGGVIWNPKNAFKLENATVLVLADMSLRGIGFSRTVWLDILSKQLPLFEKRKQILNKWVEDNVPKFCRSGDLFSSIPTCAVDWQSPTQVVKLFKYLGICPREVSKSTKKLEYTVGAKELLKTMRAELQESYSYNKDKPIDSLEELKLAYLLFKKSQMSCTTFGASWLDYVHPITGRVHSNFNQYMNSSRLSSNNPNIQNLPQGEYRDAFIPSPLTDFISVDYASQEVRILADVSANPVMEDFFVNGSKIFGDDMHSFSATQMMRAKTGDDTIVVSKKSHPKERNISKSLTFSLSYGGSAHSIKFKLGLELEETETFIQSFFDGFPGLEEDFTNRKKFAIDNGYIILDKATDRRYFFPQYEKMKKAEELAKSYYTRDMSAEERAEVKLIPEVKEAWKTFFTLKGKLERRALNYGIQGLAAGMTKLALVLLYKAGIALVSCVHDEICAEGNEKDAKTIERLMIEAGKYFCKRVPMGAEASVGDKWIH